MDAERYHKVVEIFHEAADLEGEAREAFLVQACQGDAELRREVEILLGHDDLDDEILLEKRSEIGSELLDGIDGGLPEFPGSSMPPLERIGPYRIIEKIGEGGMGTVFLAEQDHPRRRVALKMIRPGLFSPRLIKRFRFEADVLGRLKHPGIAQIFEASEIDTDAGSLPYFVMEYVDGVGLKKYAELHDPDVRSRLELVARIADAVHHAHRKGILHRDLKPDNILVVKATGTTRAEASSEFAHLGQPKILDFGVARATDSDVQVTTMQTDVGQLIGTLTYMSPEQVAGDSSLLDERSDIYALGVLLYELLAGRPPLDLREKSIPEAGRIIREEEPTRLASIHTDYRGDIDTITCKALEKDRERRYESASAFAEDIRRYLAHEPIVAHPPSTLYQLRKFARRHKGLVGGLVLSFLILIAGIVISVVLAVRATRGEADARRSSYQFSITAAEAVGDKDPHRARKHLEMIPVEFRGWEWRHLNARLQANLADFTGVFHGIAVAGDGSVVALQEREGTVELVEIPGGRARAVFSAPEKLTQLCLSPDGSRLAALSEEEKKLIVWDSSTRKRLTEIPVPGPQSIKLRLSSKGRFLFFCSEMDFFAFETATGRMAVRETLDHIVRTMDCDPDEERFAVATLGRNLYQYTTSGERLLLKRTTESPNVIAFSHDGTRLALGDLQRTIRIVDGSTFEPLHVLNGHTDGVSVLAFSPDGRRLVSASADNTIRLWNLDTGQPERVFLGFPDRKGPSYLVFSRDGRMIAMGHRSTIRLLSTNLDARRVLEGHESYVYHVTFSPDGSLLASSAFTEETRLWNGLTGEPLAAFRTRSPHRRLSFSRDGSRLLVSDGIQVSIWDPAACRAVGVPRTAMDQKLLDPDLDYWAAAACGAKESPDAGERRVSSPDGTLVAEGTFRTLKRSMREGKHHFESGCEEILIKDLATKETIKKIGSFDCGVLSVAFSPDGKKLASGLRDGTVNVWDLASGEKLATMKGHTSSVYSIDYSPDGARIVTGGNDGMIFLWDAETYDEVLVLSGHTTYVHSVCFSPDGTLIASGSGDGTVRLWDSIPLAERRHEFEQARERRIEAEPMVTRLLEELDDPLDVADRLRADASLSEELRRAALLLLLERFASR